MNQKVTWHPELISSEGLAKALDFCKENGQDLTIKEITQIIGLIAPLISKTQQAALLYDWIMARHRSNKLTQEEAEQIFEWIAPRVPKELLWQELKRRGAI